VNLGNEGDFWVMGDELGPGPSTWPNTDSIQGLQTRTGLRIKVTSIPGLVMQFEVSGYQTWTRDGGSDMEPALDTNALKTSTPTKGIGASKSDAFWPVNPASSSAATLAVGPWTRSPLLFATAFGLTALSAMYSLSL
jgi:hypothetical protein